MLSRLLAKLFKAKGKRVVIEVLYARDTGQLLLHIQRGDQHYILRVDDLRVRYWLAVGWLYDKCQAGIVPIPAYEQTTAMLTALLNSVA